MTSIYWKHVLCYLGLNFGVKTPEKWLIKTCFSWFLTGRIESTCVTNCENLDCYLKSNFLWINEIYIVLLKLNQIWNSFCVLSTWHYYLNLCCISIRYMCGILVAVFLAHAKSDLLSFTLVFFTVQIFPG